MQEIFEIIIGCFSKEELKLLQELDSWSFSEQLSERFSTKYLPLISLDEIQKHLQTKIDKYRSFLNEENVFVLKDIIFDEIEKEIFVSHATHLWNEEMINSLKSSATSFFVKKNVLWAIDLIVSSIKQEIREELNIKIEDQIYDLRMQLVARWHRSLLATSKKVFKDQLLFSSLIDRYSLDYLNKQTSSYKIYFQAFLEDVDAFFLYPGTRRTQKILFHTLDTGRSIGFMNFLRVYKAYTRPNIVAIWIFFLFPTLMMVLLFLIAHMI